MRRLWKAPNGEQAEVGYPVFLCRITTYHIVNSSAFGYHSANIHLSSQMKSDKQVERAAEKFANRWSDKKLQKENQKSKDFWYELVQDVFGIEHPTEFMEEEKPIQVETTKRKIINNIDFYIPSTRVVIEHKSRGVDLRAPQRQSDGSWKTPFQQALDYTRFLSFDEVPRWIVTCNFNEFLIYDRRFPGREPSSVLLTNLHKDIHRLRFIVDKEVDHVHSEEELSFQAGEIIGEIYSELLEATGNTTDPEILRQLNIFCVRLVFCYYAEDSGLFPHHKQFTDYLTKFNDARALRSGLKEVFEVLNMDDDDPRRTVQPKELSDFPYTNGGLFADDIEIPQMSERLRLLLLQQEHGSFNWKTISPTIFGSLFESTLNPETRHEGGMYYTSVENIHKVIEPLFLQDLANELDIILKVKNDKIRNEKLTQYQQKLASLTFLDPACGSGNFLTETYLSLRRLENIAINVRLGDSNKQLHLPKMAQTILVSPSQFYGIEINDFAVEVARTALWISEAQMFQETARILGQHADFLPLKSNLNIIQDDALHTDWSHVVGKRKLNYIIGNPPFAGYSEQTKMQKESLKHVLVKANGKPIRAAGKVDFVAGWYYKACEMMQSTSIRAALVSTNSVTQGEQVAYIWQPLKERFDIRFDFAYRTFRWDSEVKSKKKGKKKENKRRKTAQVHCVIISFSLCKKAPACPVIYCADGTKIEATRINPYLLDKEDAFILPKTKPLCKVPCMVYGNKPADGNGFILTEKERQEVVEKEPSIEKYIRPLLGAKEFLQGDRRYCLWLVGADPYDMYSSSFIKRRLKQVKEFRQNSTKEATIECENSPLFQEIRQPDCDYLLVPRHSSENRTYIPMDFISPQCIATDAVQMVPNATLYDFGILQSRVHMVWMRAVCGRIKSDFRYSKDLVYNNFPWPTLSWKYQEVISETAQAILDARNVHRGSSMAAMYSPMCMHQELREAHTKNDSAVMTAYGFDLSLSDDEIFDRLFTMYQQLITSPKKEKKKRKKNPQKRKKRISINA